MKHMPQPGSRRLGLAKLPLFLGAAMCFAYSADAQQQSLELVPSSVFQKLPSSTPVILAKPETSPSDDGTVDESALRYYAAHGETARVKAETRRLQELYPNWQAPSDLDLMKPSPPEEAPLWDLFTAGRFDDLRAAIAARRSAEPGWEPSADLAHKLELALLRREITALADKAAWGGIVARVNGDMNIVKTADIDIAWLIAEAYAHLGQTRAAAAAYRVILESHSETALRIATLQKAMVNLPIADVEPLISMGQLTKDGTNEFLPIRDDITVARIVAFLHNKPAAPVDPADLAAFGDHAQKLGSPDLLGLLGWYGLGRHQFSEAFEWFKAAIAHGGDAVVAHGLALTLDAMGQEREAEEVTYAWREPFINNAVFYIDILHRVLTRAYDVPVDPLRVDRFAKLVLATSSGFGAEALAWRAYNSCQWDAALDWFERAAAWKPRESVIYGYALTLQRLKRMREYFEVLNRYDGLFPRVVDLAFNIDAQPDNPPICVGAPIARVATTPVFGRIPRPGATGIPGRPAIAVKRSEFPIAVAAENPLRFLPGSERYDHSRDGEFLRQGQAAAPPLVVRRVIGVAAMPYERLGYSLLPAWNGIDRPSRRDFTLPPVGTLARAELSNEPRTEGRPNRPAAETDRFGPFDTGSGDPRAAR
jgi:tetratricopeptide (TPR) repeat protein